MRISTSILKASAAALPVACLLVLGMSASASAQEAVQIPAIVDFERDAVQLRDRIERPPVDPDLADTAVVLTNGGNTRAYAVCWAFDGDGKPLGRTRLKIPALGLRWALASDLSNDVDFIGSVRCYVSGNVHGTAVFFGPGITDLPTRPVPQVSAVNGHRLEFPLVAHY